MGIILAPFLLALVYHLLPGLWYGIAGISGHPNKWVAVERMARRTLCLFLPAFFLPFLAYSGQSVDYSFMFLQIAIGGGLVVYGYIISPATDGLNKYECKIDKASAFLAGGVFPIAWFSLADGLIKELGIKWVY